MAEFDSQIEGNLRVTGQLEVIQDVKAPNVQKIESDVKIISSQTTQVIGALGTLIDQAASDAYLTTTEKRSVLTKWEEVKTEYPIIRQGAIDDGISSGDALIVNFDGAYTALRTYLLVDPGVLSDMTTGEEIEPVAFVAAWENYYNYRTQLVSARIALKANAADVNTGSYLGMFAAAPSDKVTGDWYLNSGDGLIRIWNGTAWTTSGVTWLHKIAAIEDLYSIAASASQVFTSMIVASEAFIEELASKTIKSAELCEDGTTSRVEFQLNDAILLFRNASQTLMQQISEAAFTSYEGPGDYRRALRVSGNKISWLDAPEGGTEKEKVKMFRAPNESRVRIEGSIGKYDNTLNVTEKTISATGRNWTGGAWSPSLPLFLAIPYHLTNGTNVCATSPDGTVWTERTISATARKWIRGCWSKSLGLFVIVAHDSTICATSPDGITWTERTISATVRDWNDVEWCEGLSLFIAIANNSTICATSPDGITWTERTISATARYWYGIVWAKSLGRVLIVEVNSTICATSEDGTNWTERTISATSRNWRKPVWAETLGRFLIYDGYNSTICATSPDGITWTERTISATARDWQGGAYCPGFEYFFLVAGGSSGDTIYATSPDGITWTERTISATARNWDAVIASPELVKIVFLATYTATICALVTNIGYQEIQTEEVFTPGDCTFFMPVFRAAYNTTVSDGSGGYYHLNQWVSEAWGQGGTSSYLREYWPSYSIYGTPTTLTKIFEHKLKSKGTYRIQFSLTRWAGSGTVYAQIYKNGSAVGTLRSRATTGTWASWSEDLSFEKGDLLQIYFRVSNNSTGGNIGKVRIKVAEYGQIE